MSELSRPLVAMLSTALSTSSDSTRADVQRLRDALGPALGRCLGMPDATWSELVDAGAVEGSWDEWRVAGLLAADDVDSDPTPEVTLDVLATLADELVHRRRVSPGPWEGADRQASVVSPRWQEGLRAREVVFAIERAMELIERGDAAGVARVAATIDERDPAGSRFPDLAGSLRACSDDLHSGALSSGALARLRTSLAATPFAASVDRLSFGPGTEPVAT